MITQLRMKNFRRFEDQTIEFDKISYIEGQNNAGKTTIFLAIEYVLFGTVAGFRSQAALFQPGKKKMGVEIIYTGRNNKTYRLQRMHELRGKGASGHYTLKEIIEENERYILSSDFANTSEEMLQLQIIESLGVSKRLFDVALNIKQGEITSILEGNTYLDIVLGVSAASLAQKQLNGVALGFEKETSQYDTLNATLTGLQNEEKELQKQQKSLDSEIDKLQQKTDQQQAVMDTATAQREQLQPVITSYEQYHQLCLRWDRAHERLHEHLQRLHKAEESGNTENMEQELGKLTTQVEQDETIIKKIDEKIQQTTTNLRSQEQLLGDLKGKISRRENLPKGEATCEVCGAPIDQQRVEQELKTWTAEQEEVNKQIQIIERELEQLKNQQKEAQLRVQQYNVKISEYQATLKQVQNLKEEEKELQEQLETEDEVLLDAAVELYELLQEYNDSKTEEKQKITIPKPEILQLETLVVLDKEVIMARSMDSVYSNKLPAEAQQLQKMVDETQVEVRVISGQLNDRQQQKQQLEPRMQVINKQLADTKTQMQLLQKKRGAAERMRTAARVFKSLQAALRDQAASSLAKKTLYYHQQLAASDEYAKLSVDPKNYMIYVTPKDIGEEVPAATYQGGGHKLLLGIAFKLAIVNVVTKPPFILLDEPTYGLDSGHKTALFDKIDELTKSQLLLITHQRDGRPVDGTLFEVRKDGEHSKVEVVG